MSSPASSALTPLRRVEKPISVRHIGPVEVRPLQELVGRLSERMWDAEDARKENDFFCFHDTQHVIFRFIPGNRDPRDAYSNPNWEVLKSVFLPVMEQAIQPYGFQQPAFPKAMLARLKAGATIDQHVDGAGSNLVTHKIHVPVQTNPGAHLHVGDERFHLEVGQAYEVNNTIRHGAVNLGTTDRIHFIFEVFETAGLAIP